MNAAALALHRRLQRVRREGIEPSLTPEERLLRLSSPPPAPTRLGPFAGAPAAEAAVPRRPGFGVPMDVTASLQRLQLLDELRWRRYALEHCGYNGRAAKRIAALDAEIARREAAYVASVRANGTSPAASPAPAPTPLRARDALGALLQGDPAPTASPPAPAPRRSRRRRSLRSLPGPATAGFR
jgi:hypothetical protein